MEEPTRWVNQMAVVKKNESLRICLDPRNLNKGAYYLLSTVDEMAANLSGAKFFCKPHGLDFACCRWMKLVVNFALFKRLGEGIHS